MFSKSARNAKTSSAGLWIVTVFSNACMVASLGQVPGRRTAAVGSCPAGHALDGGAAPSARLAAPGLLRHGVPCFLTVPRATTSSAAAARLDLRRQQPQHLQLAGQLLDHARYRLCRQA